MSRNNVVQAFNAQKRQMAELLLPLCPYINIDALYDGVRVPDFLRNKQLTLRIGRDPRVMGMPDLEFSEFGWIVVQRQRHHVFVPWEACQNFWVGAPFHGPAVVWPELSAQPPANEQPKSSSAKPKPVENASPKLGRPSLKVVK